MVPPQPNTADTRGKKAAARKSQRLAQKQQCPLNRELIQEANRVRQTQYDEMKRSMRKLMTREELIADKKRIADEKRKQQMKKNWFILG